jgi:hypothetical protein
MEAGMRHTIWRYLIDRENGTITIFAVIVLSSLLLFFGTLIDYARIAAMGLMSENAARTGVRSVLSAYDSWLYERYGLFGRGGSEGEEIFREVLEGSRGEEAAAGGFDLVRTRFEDAKLHTSHVLGAHDVFARQVLEEMKYKAPVDMTLEVVAKLVPLGDSLRQSGETFHTLDELRKLYEKREKLLEDVLLLQEQAADIVAESEALPLVPAGKAALKLGGNSVHNGTVQSLLERFAAYAGQVGQDGGADEPENGDGIASFEEEAASLAGRLRSASAALEQKHAELLSRARRQLEQAEAVNDEMIRINSRTDSSSGYDGVRGKDVPGAEPYPDAGTAASELEEVRSSGDKLIRNEGWWSSYRQELGDQETSGKGIVSEVEQLLSRLSSAMASPGSAAATRLLNEGVTEIQLAVKHYESVYAGQASLLAKRKTELADADMKKQLKETEAKTAAAWQNAGRLLNGLAGMRDLPEHRELFQSVKSRYEDSLLFNQKQQEDGNNAGTGWSQAKDANQAVERSTGQMEGLFAGMSDMLAKSRDMFYYGEYASDRFSHFAPQQLLDLMENGDIEGIAEAASFHNQEMEYWLYGFHDPIGNLIAAYGELFGVRLAVRTMEGLIVSKNLGHPLLILSGAILYGLEKTAEDMLSFARKGSAPLSKYAKVELGYLDYLRLFALLHGGKEEERLSRMIAVIEQNSDLVLAQVPSGVTGEASISIKLWFLPGATKLIGRLGLLKGRVNDGRFESSETVGWSY